MIAIKDIDEISFIASNESEDDENNSFHSEKECITIGVGSISINRIEEVLREWDKKIFISYGSTYNNKYLFMDIRDENIVSKSKNENLFSIAVDQHRNVWKKDMDVNERVRKYISFKEHIPEIIHFNNVFNEYKDNKGKELFASVFGEVAYIDGNKTINWENGIRDFWNYMRYTEKPYDYLSSKHKEIEEITSIKMQAHSFDNVPASCDAVAKIDSIIIDSIKTCVVRTYRKGINDFFEAGRIYASKKKVFACRKDIYGRFIAFDEWRNNIFDWNYQLIDFDPKVIEGTPIEYFGDVISKTPVNMRSVFIWAFLANDNCEKIAKINDDCFNGFCNFMKIVMSGTFGKTFSAENIVEAIIGKADNKKKGFSQVFGINSYQIKQVVSSFKYQSVQKYYPSQFGVVDDMKYIYGDIQDLDNGSFNKMFEFISNIYRFNQTGLALIHYKSYVLKAMNECVRTYGIDGAIELISEIKKISNWTNSYKDPITGIHISCHYLITDYIDYVRMVGQIGNTHRFKAKFDNVDCLIKAHNIMIDMCNQSKDENYDEKWNFVKDKWDRFKYSNDKFIIITPSSPTDLTKEGVMLHHCVKSYIEQVAEGRTNIVFIREKANPDKPFYTVEISNNNSIEQVHGACNKNAEENSMVASFIKEWAKEKGLKIHNINKKR